MEISLANIYVISTCMYLFTFQVFLFESWNFLDHNFPSAKVVGCAQSSIVNLVEVSQSQQK